MGIRKVVNSFLIILFIIMTGELCAKDDEMTEYGLTLSPEKCLLLNKAKECDIVVNVNWKTKTKGDYCLYNNLSVLPITCWENDQQAKKDFLLSFTKNIHFELRHKKNNNVVFMATLKLYKKTSNLRRKRRNPWSFY